MKSAEELSGQSLPLEGLVEQYRPALHAFARRWVKDADRCDDLIQESLLLSWKKKVAFTDPRAFLAWSRETLRYLAFAEQRSRQRPEPGPTPAPAAGDAADEVLDCAVRVVRLNPGENPRILSVFILHTVFHLGVRYLSYVLEMPKSTVARKLEEIRQRLARGPWEQKTPPDEELAVVPVLEDLSFGLIRERLMSAQIRSAKETCAFPNELLWKAIARFPSAQTRLLNALVMNISYAFRRCAPDADLESERARLRRMADARSLDESRDRAEYMVLRSMPEAGPAPWQALMDRFRHRPPWPGMVTGLELAQGWEQARTYLLSRFRPSEIDNSFYLSYLAGHYALRRGEPRIAHRHLTRILEFYCPEYFRPHVDQLRALCVRDWHESGTPFHEPTQLLA